jgi:hypothetical protein
MPNDARAWADRPHPSGHSIKSPRGKRVSVPLRGHPGLYPYAKIELALGGGRRTRGLLGEPYR